MGTQVGFGVRDQGFGRIAGHLADSDRQRGKLRVGALLPGRRIPLRLVLFHEDEVGHRLDGYQTDLGMKGFILAERNLAGRHVRGESRIFLLAETDQKRFQLLGHRLLGPVGRGDELAEMT